MAARIREQLQHVEPVRELKMMGGLCFMVDEKMCVGIIKDELMCRINPLEMEDLLQLDGCRMMDFTARPMRGYVQVEPRVLAKNSELEFWVNKCLDYNPLAKSSKKKPKK